MSKLKRCQIVSVGKRRDGGMRYWCLEHKADATAKYGQQAKYCRYAHVPSIKSDEIVQIDISNYKGGIGLWGAVPPIYDTTRRNIDYGIHVHARKFAGGEKNIDATYRRVHLFDNLKSITKEGLILSELDAIYYMVTSVFGFPMKYVECSLCGFSHLDKDWFSVHPHQRHLCAGCGQYFRDTDVAVGNPIMKVREIIGSSVQATRLAKNNKQISQQDFQGGIRIWGSNSAFLWTVSQSEEEGIHIHAFNKDGFKVLDETFSKVQIDGIELDPQMVRLFMAQSTLPHLTGRISDVHCPRCKESHFDIGELAFTPHEVHTCANCKEEFRSGSRIRKVISNPMIGILTRLAKNAPQSPQKHKMNLIPETL